MHNIQDLIAHLIQMYPWLCVVIFARTYSRVRNSERIQESILTKILVNKIARIYLDSCKSYGEKSKDSCLDSRTWSQISDLVFSKPKHNLRSASKLLFVQSSSSAKSCDDHAFGISLTLSELWNKPPDHMINGKTLVQFKSSLKMHLFNVSYM